MLINIQLKLWIFYIQECLFERVINYFPEGDLSKFDGMNQEEFNKYIRSVIGITEYEKMGKGITLRAAEVKELYKILKNIAEE